MAYQEDKRGQDRTLDRGEWTKEPARQDPRSGRGGYSGPDDLEDRITDALDGKDLLDKDAYGEFAPDYVRRRAGSGERGRHEAPGSDPEEDEEEEEQFDDGLDTRRFTSQDLDMDADIDDDEPTFRDEPPRRNPIVDEPPPRPKVVVAEPAPRVFVDPQAEYGPQDEPPRGGGQATKWLMAILISVLAIGAVVAALFAFMPSLGGEESEPTPTPTNFLEGLLRPPADQTTSTPSPTMTPPAVKIYSITVTAGTGGSVSPSGRADVQEGGSVTFTITPQVGYELAQLLIDGSNVSVQGSYTFSDVRQDHTLYAVFQEMAAPPEEITPEPTAEPTQEPQPEVVPEPEAPPPPEGMEGDLGPG